MEDSGIIRIEEASREERRKIGAATKDLGLDGSPIKDMSVYFGGPKQKKKGGRKKGQKNLTLKERLRRRGYEV